MQFSTRNIHKEAEFKATRSSGKGGQNVNKVSTKVEVRLNINDSSLLSEEEKEIIRKKLSTKISADGLLITNDQSSRSQLDNKTAAIAKLYKMLDKCFVVAKKRKATKPSKGSKEKRLQTKKIRSEIKAGRKLRAE